MSFFLIIDLYFLIATEIVNPITEPVIPIGKPRKEAKAKVEIPPAIAQSKIRKCSI